jgi:hypothetical protein
MYPDQNERVQRDKTPDVAPRATAYTSPKRRGVQVKNKFHINPVNQRGLHESLTGRMFYFAEHCSSTIKLISARNKITRNRYTTTIASKI